MNKQDYLRMLEDGHTAMDDFQNQGDTSRLSYLADYIFDFTTYEDEMGELFARKAVEVCAAISERRTFAYLGASDENRMWYLIMCNMPFFANRLEWGTSIRGAWWDEPVTLDTCGLFWQGEQVTAPMKFAHGEWCEFIDAVREFAAGSKQPNAEVTGQPSTGAART